MASIQLDTENPGSKPLQRYLKDHKIKVKKVGGNIFNFMGRKLDLESLITDWWGAEWELYNQIKESVITPSYNEFINEGRSANIKKLKKNPEIAKNMIPKTLSDAYDETYEEWLQYDGMLDWGKWDMIAGYGRDYDEEGNFWYIENGNWEQPKDMAGMDFDAGVEFIRRSITSIRDKAAKELDNITKKIAKHTPNLGKVEDLLAWYNVDLSPTNVTIGRVSPKKINVYSDYGIADVKDEDLERFKLTRDEFLGILVSYM